MVISFNMRELYLYRRTKDFKRIKITLVSINRIFQDELSVKNMNKIFLLITKNQTDISISNEIGCIFRRHNIMEYKDPADSLNIDVFFKVEGYACLYKSYGKTVDAIVENDITMTFVRDSKPSGLFAYFQEHGYQVSNPFKGIYYITGNILFPAQIVVTKELKPELHIWLRALSGKLEKQDLQNLLEHIWQLTGKMDREYAEAVLEVAFRANIQILKEWMEMLI